MLATLLVRETDRQRERRCLQKYFQMHQDLHSKYFQIFSNASRLALKICQLLSSLLALLLQNNQYFHGKSIYNFFPHIWWVGQKYQIKPEIVDTTNTKNVKANYTYNNTKEGTRTNIEARRWWVGQKDQKYKVEISDQTRSINVYK